MGSEPILPELAADKALFCRPGQTARWRAALDAKGEFGTAIFETPYLPDDIDAIESYLALMRDSAGIPIFDDIVVRGTP
jgi:hypothetical protein